jgi:hypothetical protein
MKRIVLACAAAAVLGLAPAGCSQNSKINSPFAKVDSTKAPKKAEYFEVRREGKVYVLGSPDSLKQFNEGQTPKVKPVPDLGGKTVFVENRSYTDFNRLLEDYKKQHNL